MITLPLKAYLHFELDAEPRKVKGEFVPVKYPRYELRAMAGGWSGLDKLRNSKGKVRFTKLPTDANKNRKTDSPEYFLQCQPRGSKSVKLSGLRFEFSERLDILYASGEPYHKEYYPKSDGSNGTLNPLYDEFCLNHKYLFIKPVSSTEQDAWIDMLIIEGDDVDAWRKRLSLGSYDEQIEKIKSVSKPV